MRARFHKYQAMGNDMIVIDPSQCDLAMTAAVIRLICDRHYGPGADGICYGPIPHSTSLPAMRFFNPDGSEAEKSGNGLRIFARYLWDNQLVAQPVFAIAIGDEIIPAQVLDEATQMIAMNIGQLSFEWVAKQLEIGDEIVEITSVSIGNPHAVLFTEDLQQIHTLGPTIEAAPHFPHRTNVQLVKILDPHNIQIEIWERGAGYTLASGTSCSAATGAAVKMGYCRSPVEVRMAGGVARVTISDDWQVELVGSVSAVYQASFSNDMLQRLRQASLSPN
jgi:diaminopimelate epimerase